MQFPVGAKQPITHADVRPPADLQGKYAHPTSERPAAIRIASITQGVDNSLQSIAHDQFHRISRT
jgi:hypothetical protein